ncbi:MAG: hypothetical protein JW709_13610 [Sedimentisphaerales bacterium]|nr:hypothetical protein [Sedimentisphaerales bacterium]
MKISPDSAIQRLIQDRLRISEYESVTLQSSRVNQREWRINTRFGEQNHQLVLQRYSVRAPGFRLLVQQKTGELIEIEPPLPATYRGYVEGVSNSRVTASERNGLLEAKVQLGAGPEETWLVKPVTKILPDCPNEQHIVYRADQVQGSGGTCAVTDEIHIRSLSEGAPADGDVVNMDVQVCEIACDADVEYYQLNGSSVDDTVADIEMIINGVSDIYELDTQVTFQITAIIVRTEEPDPYTATAPLQLLGQFEDYWDLNHGDIDRDAAQLFTGKDLDGSALGIAYQDGLCWREYSVVQSLHTSELVERIALSAHEIGHLFDASHCDGVDVWCRIMCSALGGCSEGFCSFGPYSVNSIRTAAAGASCLSPGTVGVPCTSVPFFDDFSYCGYYDVPDPARWTAADRIDCHYGKIVLKIGKDYGGNMRFGTLRTRPMAVTGPATISYQVNPNYAPTGQYLKVEYFDSALYTWHLLQSIPATTGQAGWTPYEHPMPLDGYGDYFALRFTGYGNTVGSYSWLIDDVGVTPAPCLGSFDGDNDVDLEDFAILAAAWLSTEGEPTWNADCDISDPTDGVININDLMAFASNWLCGK